MQQPLTLQSSTTATVSLSRALLQSPALAYDDRFLSRRMRILVKERAEIDAPLELIEAAAARLHLPRGYPLAHEQPPLPSGYTHISL